MACGCTKQTIRSCPPFANLQDVQALADSISECCKGNVECGESKANFLAEAFPNGVTDCNCEVLFVNDNCGHSWISTDNGVTWVSLSGDDCIGHVPLGTARADFLSVGFPDGFPPLAQCPELTIIEGGGLAIYKGVSSLVSVFPNEWKAVGGGLRGAFITNKPTVSPTYLNVPNGVFTKVTFNTAVYDTGGWFNGVDGFSIDTSGLYRISGGIYLAQSPATPPFNQPPHVDLIIGRNGVLTTGSDDAMIFASSHPYVLGANSYINTTKVVPLNFADVVDMHVLPYNDPENDGRIRLNHSQTFLQLERLSP